MSEPDSPEVRELKAALERTVDELEEQRVAAIELRMLLDASEARLRTMSAELEEAREAAREADERREAARVEAIEMRVILDATEHRVAKLRDDVAALTQERDSTVVRLDRLARELLDSQEERRVLEALLEEVSPKLDAGERAAAELEEVRARTAAELERLRAAAAADASAAAAQLEELRAKTNETAERLRQELEAQRQGADRLRARVEELEREQTEGTRRLSSVETTHALELSDRAEEVRTLQEELSRAVQENAALQRAADEAQAQLAAAAEEAELLELRVHELEARPVPAAAAAASPFAPAAAHAEPAAPARDGLRLASDPGLESLLKEIEVAEAESPTRPPARAETSNVSMHGLTVVHLDDRPEYREALQSAVSQFAGARYLAVDSLAETPPLGHCVVVANLLSSSFDVLAAVADAERWGLAEPRAFTYCADGTRGVVLGTVEYFPAPFDADACTARLLQNGVQRLLTVSDHIELMNEIRATMARFQGSTSVALDARQAFELAALVRPEFVLVDLLLPRGEGLRLVARLRADAKTAAIPAALLWDRALDASDLRAHAARVARDTLLAPEELKRAFTSALSDPGLREPLRQTA